MRSTAPTKDDSLFYGDHREYWITTVEKAQKEGRVTENDIRYIREFLGDLTAYKGISARRREKLTGHLCGWRRFIPEYDQCTIGDLTIGINSLREAKTNRGKPYSATTLHDYVSVMKQFYMWMIDNEYSMIPEKKVAKIKVPPKPKMTKTAGDMLTPEEVEDFLSACRNSRDRAFFCMLYESGCRIGELGTLTWGELMFDSKGVICNTDFKTGKPRYIRMVLSHQPLSQWRTDYPYEQSPDALVFLNRFGGPLSHAAITKNMRVIAKRAGITKHLTAHLWRHSRITHMIRDDISLPVVGMMMWGDPTAPELHTYLHLTGGDVDAAILQHYGVETIQEARKKSVEPKVCPVCKFVHPPSAQFCCECGTPLTKSAINDVTRAKQDIMGTPDVMEETTNELVSLSHHEGNH